MLKKFSKKTMRLLSMFLTLSMIFSTVGLISPTTVFASDNVIEATSETGNDGIALAETEEEYIEIRTIQDLYNIRLDLTANYILMNDIDLTEATAKGGDWDFIGNGWNPIGSGDIYGNSAFSGTFDGNGHKIIGMRIDVTSLPSGVSNNVHLGLFANVTGTVRNLEISGSISYKQEKSFYIGSIAGNCNGVIENCVNNANILGQATDYDINGYVGGIVGSAGTEAMLMQCRNTGEISSHSVKGEYKSSSGDINIAGGIVGNATTTTYISHCYNTGKIFAKASGYDSYGNEGEGYAAGISSYGKISNCYNTAEINATAWRFGEEYAYGIGGNATNCYNTGIIVAIDGKYGISDSKSTNCYYLSGSGNSSTGATALTESQMKIQSMYPGFDFENVWLHKPNALYPYPQLKDNPQDIRVIESIELFSLPDKTIYEYGETLDLSGCEIKTTFDTGFEIIVVTNEMVIGYNPQKTGMQTLTITYLGEQMTFTVTVNEQVFVPVHTIEDLYNIRSNLSGDYILMNDIVLTEATAKGGDWDFMGNGWNPIGSGNIYGNDAFSGTFNGNGHKIIGMRIDVTTLPSGVSNNVYLGLFANVTGSVKNLEISGNINYKAGKSFYIGSVAGNSNGVIENCVNKTNIVGKSNTFNIDGYVGGIVGNADSEAQIRYCANNGEISSLSVQNKNTACKDDINFASGIVGKSKDTTVISHCLNTGKISSQSSGDGSSYQGMAYSSGISRNGNISYCYNTAEIIASGSPWGYSYAYGIGGASNQCYNIGVISGENLKSAISNSTNTNCYYLNGSGASSSGAVSLTETQMKIKTMYPEFDFENVWILNEYANHPYPQLRSNIQDLEESASLVSIISWPTKTEYLTGDSLNLEGCVIDVTYVSGRKELLNVTSDMISGYDNTLAGEQTVTVTYRGSSDTFPVTVKARPEVTSVELISEPDEKEFRVGTAFDFSGAQIKVTYSNNTTEIVDVTVDITTGGNIHHLGKQTITVLFYGKSDTFEVTVTPVSIKALRLDSIPDKLSYLEGQKLDLTGLVLVAEMNNGTENAVSTGYTVSGYSSKPGKHTVVLEYMGKTVSFEVTVSARKVESLVLKSVPKKTEYIQGQPFDPDGMMIVATFDNGDIEVVEDYELSGFDDVPGLKTLVASYGGKHVAFSVSVIARVITTYKITSYPAKLEYLQYDQFDPTGLEVKATYNDGITETVTDYEVVGFSSNPGTHTISVAYKGWVETFDITVNPRVLTNLVVVPPEKLIYYLNEVFDNTGLKVTACYNNGQKIDVDDYYVSGFDSNTPGTKTITVEYGGISSSFSILVSERSEITTEGSFSVGSIIGRLGENIKVPVSVFKNTGIAGFKHTIKFNASNLNFVAVNLADTYSAGTLVVNDEKASDGEISIVWFDTKDVVNDGVVYNLEFEILETATDGVSDITIEFNNNDNGNISGENVLFNAFNGSVEIRSYWLGDLNGDREYRVADLLYLAQYVAGIEKTLTDKQKLSADVNEDTIIDIHDVIMLQQWIVNAGVPNVQTFALFASPKSNSDDVTKISLGEIKGKVGQEVVVPVTIENNVGISAFMFEVAYNTEDLTFVSAELGGVLDKGVLITQVDEENQRLIVLWYSTEGDVSADGEMLPLTFKINDTASGTYDLSVRYLAEDIINEARDEIICSIESGKILVGSVLTGNLTSLLVDGNNDVTLVLSNGTEVVDELSISKGDYEFDSVAPGEYTLTVEKKNHATRTYTITVGDEDVSLDVKLNLLGDIDGNGSVNMMDYLKAKQHSQGKNLLEDYAFDCADVSGDGKVNMMDYIKLKQHAQGTSSIWE